jgi:hypothetical protein
MSPTAVALIGGTIIIGPRMPQWWGFVRWRIFWFYCFGAVVALIIVWLIELIGVLTTIIQFLTGAGGLLFDIFQGSVPDRTTTGRKSHVLRASHFVSFGPINDEIVLWPMLPAIAIAIAGGALAPM